MVYYVTDHYASYTAVLVRLSRVNHALRDLLCMAYKFVSQQDRVQFPSAEEVTSR